MSLIYISINSDFEVAYFETCLFYPLFCVLIVREGESSQLLLSSPTPHASELMLLPASQLNAPKASLSVILPIFSAISYKFMLYIIRYKPINFKLQVFFSWMRDGNYPYSMWMWAT